MRSILAILLALTSTYVLADQCPTKEFQGKFQVVELRGCQNYENWNQVTHVVNEYNKLKDEVWIRVGFNYQENPSLGFQVSKNSSNASSVDCDNIPSEKYWLWFPQSPRTDFHWGFSASNGKYRLYRGIDCTYVLEKQ